MGCKITARLKSRGRGAEGTRQRSAGGARRLGASLLAVALSLGLVLGVGVAGAVGLGPDSSDDGPSQSTAGSTLGLLVDNTPSQSDIDNGTWTGNDSNLGLYVTAAASEDVLVTFMTQGIVFRESAIGYGSLAVAPARPPAWDWTLPDTGGLDPSSGVEPAFDAWCEDADGTVAYDFSRPVTADLTLYAGWSVGEAIDVTFHGLKGTMDDPAHPGTAAEDVTLTRYVGSPYRTLPTPTRAGYTFAGWWTADGSSGAAGGWGAAITASDIVSAEVTDAYAKWEANSYWVRYVNNSGSAGTGLQLDVSVEYDLPGQKVLTWEEAKAQGGFFEPAGKRFNGWNTKPDGSGEWHAGGAALPNLTEVAGAYVSLFAEWVDDGTVEPGPFDVTFVFNDGATSDKVIEDVVKGERVPAFDDPKRSGWQFAGWFEDNGTFAKPWAFDCQILATTFVYAKWDLRLDVTVPVSVGFAVNADTGAVTAPDAGRYAVKSRTVAPVEVQQLAVESQQDELEGFFSLAGDGGDATVWAQALAATALSVRSEHAAEAIALPLADGTGVGPLWKTERALADDERAWYRLPAFSYADASIAFDETWAGADPSKRLALELGMSIPVDRLEVRADLAGPVPVTHLRVTVAAKG